MTAGRGGHALEVLLDDAAEPDVVAGPAGPARPRRRRPRRWLAAAVGLALVVVLGAVDARAERLERRALERHAGVPDVVAPLGEPLAERWRLPTHGSLTGLGDTVVTVAGEALVGLDAVTGEQRWARPVTGGGATCPVVVPAPATGPRSHDRPGTLVCFGAGRPEAERAGVVAHAFDAADGRLRAELHGPRFVATAVGIDDDVVLVGAEAGFLRVSRLALEDGLQRWRTRLAALGGGAAELVVHADPAVVALEGPTTVVLGARDGVELGRWTAARDGAAPDGAVPSGEALTRARVVSHPGAGFGVWTSRSSGRWHAPDGRPGARLDGEPVEPEVDDAGGAHRVLLRSPDGSRLSAVDVRTRRARWQRAAPDRVLLLLGGRLVVVAGDRLEAWDAASGAVAWSAPLRGDEVPFAGAPSTDGVRLLVPGRDARGAVLTAVRLADGERVWRAALPPGTAQVVALGDRLAAVGREGGGPGTAAVLG